MTAPDTIAITPTEAGHVVWHYRPPGLEPGPFTQQLLILIDMAGHENRRRLAAAFPGYAAAVDLARNHPRGIATLERIAFGRAPETVSDDDGRPHPIDPADFEERVIDHAVRVVEARIAEYRETDARDLRARIADAQRNHATAESRIRNGGEAE